jgi:elongation factor G
MDRVGANFERAVQSMRDRLGANAVPIQMPVGSEENFNAVIDPRHHEADGLERRRQRQRTGVFEVPAELRDEAELQWRTRLIEAAADCDDALMEKYFEEEGNHGRRMERPFAAVRSNENDVPSRWRHRP